MSVSTLNLTHPGVQLTSRLDTLLALVSDLPDTFAHGRDRPRWNGRHPGHDEGGVDRESRCAAGVLQDAIGGPWPD